MQGLNGTRVLPISGQGLQAAAGLQFLLSNHHLLLVRFGTLGDQNMVSVLNLLGGCRQT
jgi:hypothetical protein